MSPTNLIGPVLVQAAICGTAAALGMLIGTFLGVDSFSPIVAAAVWGGYGYWRGVTEQRGDLP